jgi:uracil-DNA glycosylase
MEWSKLMTDNVWKLKLGNFLNQNYDKIIEGVIKTKTTDLSILPEKKNLFNAFNVTSFYEVRVVILGLDPYPNKVNGKAVADGLAFSYNDDSGYVPPSLNNIFKEIRETVYNNQDIHDEFYNTNLKRWALQGVLLLNTALTVLEGNSTSHLKHWEKFTIEVLSNLNTQTGIVYILLGNKAQEFRKYINEINNYVLIAGHPSPLNTKGTFFGSRIFKKCNDILINLYGKGILW